MTGVPMDEATYRDFIMVRAALVKRLGGANEALVWARVFWRVGPENAAAHEHENALWWAASLQTIADETGLTVKQVRTAVDGLVDGGFLVRGQHAGYDRTSSYRPVFHVPSGADGSAHLGTFHVPSGADVPLIEELETSSSSKRRSERPLPNGWMPTAEHHALGAKRDVDVFAEADAFRSHAEVHDRRAANWNAAFTWWLKKSRPRERVVDDHPAKVALPGWATALKIAPEDYLENRNDAGWVESMQAIAAQRAS